VTSICQVIKSDTCVKYQYRKCVLIWSPSGVNYNTVPKMSVSKKVMLGEYTTL